MEFLGMHCYPANDKKVIVKKRPLFEKKIYLTGKTWSCLVVWVKGSLPSSVR